MNLHFNLILLWHKVTSMLFCQITYFFTSMPCLQLLWIVFCIQLVYNTLLPTPLFCKCLFDVYLKIFRRSIVCMHTQRIQTKFYPMFRDRSLHSQTKCPHRPRRCACLKSLADLYPFTEVSKLCPSRLIFSALLLRHDTVLEGKGFAQRETDYKGKYLAVANVSEFCANILVSTVIQTEFTWRTHIHIVVFQHSFR